MTHRLQHFLNVDDKARHRASLISMAIGAACGILLQENGLSFDVSAYTAIAVIAVVFTMQVSWYCQTPIRAIPGRQRITDPLLARRWFLKAATGTAVLLVLSLAPNIEAAILDRRLRALTKNPTLSPNSALQITASLDKAKTLPAALPSGTLVTVRDRIKQSALEGASVDWLAPCANALGDYARVVTRNQPQNVTLRDFFDISFWTRVIATSGANQQLRALAFEMRGMEYAMQHDAERSLADARAAEQLGGLDLGPISFMEGAALAKHNNVQDVRRAISLLTLASRVKPVFGDAAVADLQYGAAFAILAIAYYRLTDYPHAGENARRALEFVPPSFHLSQSLYKLAILSELQQGNYQAAVNEAGEYEAKIGGGEAKQWRDLVGAYPTDPNGVLHLMDATLSAQVGSHL